MSTATETWEDDNGGAVDMRDNGDGRQGRRWIRAAENIGGGDGGQRVQWRRRYGKMDTAAEDTRYGRQKICGMTEIAVLGKIDCDGRRCIATHIPNQEEEGRHRTGHWILWRGWREGGMRDMGMERIQG